MVYQLGLSPALAFGVYYMNLGEAGLQIEKMGDRSQSLLVQPVQENPGR